MAVVEENAIESIKKRRFELVVEAGAMVVASDIDYRCAAEFLANCKALKTEVNGVFAPLAKSAHDAHKAVKDEQNAHLGPIDEARKIVGGKMAAFHDERERARAEEARRIREEEEAARKAAEDEAKAEANALESMGLHDEAAAVEVVEPEPAPEPQVYTPKAPGTGTRTTKRWTFEITDPAKIPRKFLIPDERKLQAEANTHKAGADVEGVRFYSKTNVT